MSDLPESINGLPNICGSEKIVADAVQVGLEHPVVTTGSANRFPSILDVILECSGSQTPIVKC